MHAPKYMLYLAERARALGIPLIRKRLSSLDQAYDLPETGKVDVVVNASGLGAQTLIGVEDAKVYPGRGQTVLVETPRDVERVCVMSAEDFYAANDGMSLCHSLCTDTIRGKEGLKSCQCMRFAVV